MFSNYMRIVNSCETNIITILALIIKFFILFTILIGSIETWAPDIKPKISLDKELKNSPSFFGNSTDYFKILEQDDISILVGARNHIYNLSLDGLREKYQIEWYSSDADRELCALKGKSEQDCQNYIRVFARISSTQIMICGTNSYKPRCRFYGINFNNSSNNNNNNNNSNNNSKSNILNRSNRNNRSNKNNTIIQATFISKSISDINLDNEQQQQKIKQINGKLIDNEQLQLINEVEAQGRCPYNPQHNSTYIYTDGQLYSATVADFSGADPLIYRETLRTEQYDLKQLNQPAFVSALERNGYVFFFFREIAMEYMNCGKTIYSRVGRICKNDRGGPYAFSDRWTSFLKTRLNCSVPGEYPFYFDEIQSTSQIIDGLYSIYGNIKNSIVYAVFTTSVNAIPGSAVCAFSIDDILDAFEGRFKYQKDSTSNWLPLSKDDVPEPRPGQCVDDSRTLSSTSVNFVKTHTLMETTIAPLYGRPLLKRVSLNYRLTAITIDPQIQTIDNNTHDVIFVGTDNGKVIKFINIFGANGNHQTIVIAEMDALPDNAPIRELTVSQKTQSLIVVGDGHIISLPLHYCPQKYCLDCLNLQDPYCVWDINNFECKSIISIQFHSNEIIMKNYIQMLNSTENAKNLCKKFGGHSKDTLNSSNNNNNINIKNNNGNDQLPSRPRVIPTVTRGTVSGTGKSLNNNFNDINGDDISTIYTNFKDSDEQQSGSNNNNNKNSTNNNNKINNRNNYNYNSNNNNRITLTSINPEHIDQSIGNPYLNDENIYGVEGEKLQYASSNLSWSIIIVIVIFVVFTIGIVVGWHASRKLCKSSAFHTEHRNQLNPKGRPISYRNSGKDVNLLMNTSNAFSQPCNNKKDNIEHEFNTEKDRSHECKNSTENLEKEIHFSKTGTLTKVKRTYI